MKTGSRANGADLDVRKNIAVGLRRFIEAAHLSWVRRTLERHLVLLDDYDTLWPEAHDPEFRHSSEVRSAEWNDGYGAQARRALRVVSGELFIGHFDWRVQNLAFNGSEIVAIYDWTHSGVAPEAVVVGCAAASFSSTWVQPDIDTLPIVEQMHSFVSFYEDARGRSFRRT